MVTNNTIARDIPAGYSSKSENPGQQHLPVEYLSFDELYHRHYHEMQLRAYRILKNSHDAEDAVQIAFTRAHRFLHSFKGSGCIEGWLWRIITRTCFTIIAKRKAETNFLKDYARHLHQVKGYYFQNQSQAMDILALANAVSVEFGKLYYLHDVEGYKHREIAEILQISEPASKSRLARGRSLIKKILTEAD